MKIAFVIPWFGWGIPGGAEAECKGLAKHFHKARIEVEVLTTCVKEFSANWNEDYHKPGMTKEDGIDIPIRRFKVRPMDPGIFGPINQKLMKCELPLTKEEEDGYLREMINSPDLYEYMRKHKAEYDLFVFMPYMFGTTLNGAKEVYDKAVIIPCFHEEGYIHMNCMKEVFEKVAGMAFLAAPEGELANKTYDLSKVNNQVMGAGVDCDMDGDAKRFREKYNIDSPFILYAGRKEVGKNIYELMFNFMEYKDRHPSSDMKLVLLGGGHVSIPARIRKDVFDLGFVPVQDKFDAYAAADLLCQPSEHESFSIVIMESWLMKRPVIVSGNCAVTKNFAIESQGGLYYDNYYEFEAAVDCIINNDEIAHEMGENGRAYVLRNFHWDVIVEKYTKLFEEVINSNGGR